MADESLYEALNSRRVDRTLDKVLVRYRVIEGFVLAVTGRVIAIPNMQKHNSVTYENNEIPLGISK